MKERVKDLSFDSNLVAVEEHYSGDDDSHCTAIFFDFDNQKILSQISFYEKGKIRWTFEEPVEISMEDFLNSRTGFEKRVFSKSFQINRFLTNTELFEMSDDYETILNILKSVGVEEDFSVEEFVYHNKTDEERDMNDDFYIDSLKNFKGYDIIFEKSEKTFFIETEDKYLYNLRGFIGLFKDTVIDSDNFKDCYFHEVYEAFDEHPFHVVKKFSIDGITYVLSSCGQEFDETAVLAIEYIKKHNIKISDPEYLDDLDYLANLFEDEE